MVSLNEKLEDLTKQYKEVSDQAAQTTTMKVKLEGAIEMIQMLIKEEEASKEDKKDDKKK